MSEIPGDLKFLKSHEWARVEGDGKVTVGISDHAQGQLGDLVYVELPEPGDHFDAGAAIAVVPVVGEIVDGEAGGGTAGGDTIAEHILDAVADGGTKAIVFQLASLTDVHWSMSGEVVLMTLVGGLGTIFGPVVGAAIIVTMQNYLAELGAWVTVVQGVIFVLCVLLFRRGIVGEIGHLLKKSL